MNKPFKPPTLAVTRDQPQRKRKRVSYKGAQAGSDESDSENEGGPKKKKKVGKDGFERPLDNNIVNYDNAVEVQTCQLDGLAEYVCTTLWARRILIDPV